MISFTQAPKKTSPVIRSNLCVFFSFNLFFYSHYEDLESESASNGCQDAPASIEPSANQAGPTAESSGHTGSDLNLADVEKFYLCGHTHSATTSGETMKHNATSSNSEFW